MCTVTFLPARQGYRLGMNRDEQRSRVKANPPKLIKEKGRAFLAPYEPGGGTWIGLNHRGTGLALINWYSVSRRVRAYPVSRGDIVIAARAATMPDDVTAVLQDLPLKRINPYRLIGVFPGAQIIAEWRWDLQRLVVRRLPWKAQQWISSGHNESEAQRIRGSIFRTASRQQSFGTPDWLRRLHRSHAPEPGPYSTCMHRADAVTVSYTEISVQGTRGAMVYHDGPPCGHEPVT
jgi:hypothetical protein